jgi:hypothetical protein
VYQAGDAAPDHAQAETRGRNEVLAIGLVDAGGMIGKQAAERRHAVSLVPADTKYLPLFMIKLANIGKIC